MSVQKSPSFEVSGAFDVTPDTNLDNPSFKLHVYFLDERLARERHIYVNETLQSKLGIRAWATSDFGDNPSYSSVTLETNDLQMCKHLINLFKQENPSLLSESGESYILTLNGRRFPDSDHPRLLETEVLKSPPSGLESLASFRSLVSQTVVESRERLEPPPREISKVPLRHHQVVKGL